MAVRSGNVRPGCGEFVAYKPAPSLSGLRQFWQFLLSYLNRYGYSTLRRRIAMFIADPVWLTALAALITSLAGLVWSVRRRR
jgi:hypothetical protein